MDALLATKLFIPPPPPDVVARPRIDAALDRVVRHRLTLLAAPAGFGKTTALSAWRATPAGAEVPLGWVSLDAGDNDPVRFWSYVAAALESLHASSGEPALALLRAPQPPPAETVLVGVVNALADLDRDIALVLDDYHAIEAPRIHAALAFLLDHLPARLHLVIATRFDPPLPLARLRAVGALLELRSRQLRFTPAETTSFLIEAMGLDLTPADVTALAGRTEGWAAALQLAALSFRDRPDAQALIAAFAGSHRYLVDYLGDEVLARQPAETQRFLLETAILDRLSGPLCDAVTGRAGGQPMLEQLERANLFIDPLDDERRWYRLHPLFGEFLRARALALLPDQLPALHARASTWHARTGMAPEAIAHALAAGDVERAARLVEQSAEAMWQNGQLATILQWSRRLPPESTHGRPWLSLVNAWAHFLTRPYLIDINESLLATAAAIASEGEAGDAEFHGILAAIQAAAASVRQHAAPTIDHARDALASLSAASDFWRIVATVSLGMGYEAAGQVRDARKTLTEAISLCHETDNWFSALVATYNLGGVLLADGRLHDAATLCREGLDLATEHGMGHLSDVGRLNVLLGRLWYEWDDLATATRYLELALVQARHDDEELRVLVDGYGTLARVRQAQGDPAGATEALRLAERVAATYPLAWPKATVAAWKARLALAQGDIAAAARWAEPDPLAGELAVPVRDLTRLTLARLALAQDDPAAALARIAELEAATDGGATAIEAQVIAALARQADGDPETALTTVERALALAEPEGYVRLFVDEGEPLAALLGAVVRPRRRAGQPLSVRAYAERLLAALRAHPAPRRGVNGGPLAAALPQPLTPREREVLVLIAAGLANAEIAERLFISVATVKTYVNSIFAKLGATSRTQAVARARKLSILLD